MLRLKNSGGRSAEWTSYVNMQGLVHLADVSVLDLLVLTAGPVQVVRALLLRDPVQDEVVRRARVLLFDRLCGRPVRHDGGLPPHVSEGASHHLGVHGKGPLLSTSANALIARVPQVHRAGRGESLPRHRIAERITKTKIARIAQ